MKYKMKELKFNIAAAGGADIPPTRDTHNAKSRYYSKKKIIKKERKKEKNIIYICMRVRKKACIWYTCVCVCVCGVHQCLCV